MGNIILFVREKKNILQKQVRTKPLFNLSYLQSFLCLKHFQTIIGTAAIITSRVLEN